MTAKRRIENRALIIIAVMFGLGSGCAKVPEEETKAAHEALDKARQAGAAEYAPDDLQRAEYATAQLDDELRAQEQRFALTRSYKNALRLATEAKTAAEKAEAEAAEAREQARTEAETRIEEARTALEEARASFASAPAGKGTQMDLRALESDLTEVDAAIAEAGRAYQDGRFQQARIEAEAAKAAAMKVHEDIEGARAAKRKI